MAKVFNIILSLIVAYNFAGSVSGQSRIVGGYEAPADYGKFHASLQNLSGEHVCGGAVVSKWHIVTCAHCVHEADPKYMKIVAGTHDLDVGGVQNKVESIIVHPKYNYTSKEHDIAILKTKKPFDLRYIRVLQLRGAKLRERDEVTLVGFGSSEPNGLSSRKMYVLDLPVFSQKICEFAMRYTREITREMFCTFTKYGEGSCHGDSGSPLIKGDELVGVASWGIPCAVGFPDVHTRIAPYIRWIKSYTKQNFCASKRKRLNFGQ
ncbi:unnamed protein product [Chrysodeixis includens]|uniref:Peptidase S1 domain-containing protein n=1 Tax=Chrysodeixis includens TaxID=689277 RepID=A0A9N8PYW4_CHRIL|nr:unnamed protein product [Chrysodeixis includens]